ncbi:DUF4861 domain-containing protein [Flavobacterium sp. LT1R49]|uniref:DUF4861 domain-containing protein n=1 Tax=Flavobacterium arabinosi TaxID=3398737 RepID=UPI003A87F39E
MRNKFNLCLPAAFMALLFVGCKTYKNTTETGIVLTNNSNLELTDKPISIARNLLPVTNGLNNYPILVYENDTIPSQVNDLDGDGKWDELFVVTNFSASEKKNTQLVWVKQAPKFTIRTSARFGKRETENEPLQPATEETVNANQVYKKLGFQKYQTDGPSWENDKVGFRHYFDGRNSKDVFGKKLPAITPENVGINSKGAVEDNYHVMYDWGRDVFPVGSSAGLGGYALLVGNEINRLGILGTDTLNNIEKTTFKIVSEGPENSVLSYDYHNWNASGNKYQVKEITSIWPGMYGYKNTISLDGLKGNEMLLIALSNINNQKGLKVIEVGDWVCLIQHDNLGYNREWIMGTAIIVPKKGYNGYMEAPKKGQLTDSYLAKFKIENNEPISYYAVAAWELSADKNFKDSDYFNNYVINLAKQLSTEITVKINK